MPRFSERIGAVAPRQVLQVGDMDESLRVAIWNLIYSSLPASSLSVRGHGKELAAEVLNVPADEVPADAAKWLRAWS
jgi:hypothetical protein